MLYDPKWEVQTKADPFTLESLIAWLEKQPAHHPYCYSDTGHCLLASYFTAMGFENIVLGPDGFSYGDGRRNRAEMPRDFDDIAIDKLDRFRSYGVRTPRRTYGAALERARAAAGA